MSIILIYGGSVWVPPLGTVIPVGKFLNDVFQAVLRNICMTSGVMLGGGTRCRRRGLWPAEGGPKTSFEFRSFFSFFSVAR